MYKDSAIAKWPLLTRFPAKRAGVTNPVILNPPSTTWNPYAMSIQPKIWLDPNNAATRTLVGGDLDIITNLGTGPTSFSRYSTALRFPLTQNNGRTWVNRRLNSGGMISSSTISISPSGKRWTLVSIVVARSGSEIAQTFSQYSYQNSIVGGMNFGTYTVADLGIFDGTWKSPSPSNQPMGAGATIITNRRTLDGVALARYQQASATIESTNMSLTSAFSATPSLVGWGGHPNATDGPVSPLMGVSLFFDYAVSDADIAKLEWYVAYVTGYKSALKADHIYKNVDP